MLCLLHSVMAVFSVDGLDCLDRFTSYNSGKPRTLDVARQVYDRPSTVGKLKSGSCCLRYLFEDEEEW